MNKPEKLYILKENGQPALAQSVEQWHKNYTETDRVVCLQAYGDLIVSTTFLGIDQNNTGHGPPILWETRALGVKNLERRCAGNREQAEAMHTEVLTELWVGVARELAGIPPDEPNPPPTPLPDSSPPSNDVHPS